MEPVVVEEPCTVHIRNETTNKSHDRSFSISMPLPADVSDVLVHVAQLLGGYKPTELEIFTPPSQPLLDTPKKVSTRETVRDGDVFIIRERQQQQQLTTPRRQQQQTIYERLYEDKHVCTHKGCTACGDGGTSSSTRRIRGPLPRSHRSPSPHTATHNNSNSNSRSQTPRGQRLLLFSAVVEASTQTTSIPPPEQVDQSVGVAVETCSVGVGSSVKEREQQYQDCAVSVEMQKIIIALRKLK
eukprot:PhF_6_TR4219/c0_g1_i2/m.5688